MSVVARVEGLSKSYGHGTNTVHAVADASFALEANRIHGLLGRNGAGKTTLMQLLTGQEFATRGTIEVFGESPVENARVLDNVCFIKESQRYPDDFRVKHVLRSAPGSSRTGTRTSPRTSSSASACPRTVASRSCPVVSSRPSA
ncbi:hypothetical protein GCM10025869_26590 [Homoserinibacter gongjuensis]|uniref:ABC transporter domain-containing protein n=1 Tax=Homoserinibacter gongjuensis TaxID=1162968 RepID=A0ABQ6JV02_9MICO|nr:hypothetical protein GCM10025869_26590 [Homoserinibacter gongjuensis]